MSHWVKERGLFSSPNLLPKGRRRSFSCLNQLSRPCLSLYDPARRKTRGTSSTGVFCLQEGSSEIECGKDEAFQLVNKYEDYIIYINNLLSSIGDGRISVSPYDTAFVALIKDLHSNDIPQFPFSLEWIADNQLVDGSWGDKLYLCVFDRLVNTLACVVALKSWNVHSDKTEKGISYIKENVSKLENANAEHRTCGFEVIFPALLQRAKTLGIEDIPYDNPVITKIYAAKDRKLKMIPKEVMHQVQTSLLFSLEGLQDLDWEKLLKLQSKDGSFLTSPSSTAFAFMETKNQNCLEFIKNTVEIFNGGAPHAYPVDIFARLWAVDRLQRLGISRFFESEIQKCLDYVYSFWTKKGIFSARDSEFRDIDDTSMGFRLLRLHGYDVDQDVFENFKKNGKFSCYGGQINESPSPIYNLYRASQVLFPGETILEEANNFSYDFLQERVATNQLLDKWIISSHLADEISNGLNMPWYSTLPRVEARFYLEHYGGASDVWIGKTLFRMPDINNNAYHELGRLDFHKCQSQHQTEWTNMQEWGEICKLKEFGISKNDLLVAYFLAVASIFEPQKSSERIAWAKSQIISKIITSFYYRETTTLDQKDAFLAEFRNSINQGKTVNSKLLDVLHQFLEGFERSISCHLKYVWDVWLKKLHNEMANNADLFVNTLNICSGAQPSMEKILSHHEYKDLSNLTNKMCHWLSEYQLKKVNTNATNSCINLRMEIDEDMQELVRLVLLEKSDGISRKTKETFLLVAKTYYYMAYNDAEKINMHIYKVLFQPVV